VGFGRTGAGEEELKDAALRFLRRAERVSSGVACLWDSSCL